MKNNKYKKSNKNRSHGNGDDHKQPNKRYDNQGQNDRKNTPDVEIKAPYNFVPISESVFHPYGIDKKDDADKQATAYKISHDVPYKDGISGQITFNFTAKTPIFTKNSDNENDSEFNYVIDHKGNKQYFIPGTSIKGCVRNVLEIMTFGKMSKVDNKSFGLRDLNNPDYRKKIKNVHCGWMEIRADNHAYIENWQTPGRISIDAIAKEFNVPELRQLLDKDHFHSITEKKENRDKVTSPLYKYNLLKEKKPIRRFSKCKDKNGREIYRFDKKGKEGIIVLTGQSSGREEKIIGGKKKWTGKIFEFIFFKHNYTSPPLEVSDSVLKAFHTIHENSPAYTSLWGEELKKGEKIPVFFMLDDKGEVSSIGLSFMYKYPYDKDTYSAMPKEMLSNNLDMAEALFGHTIKDSENNGKESSLRGRVMFSRAKVISDNATSLEVREFPAYSPHSSYYPIYVEGGKDWNAAERIAGWKRYLVQSEPIYKMPNGSSSVNKGIEKKIKSTSFVKFLEKGTKFEMTVRFHNLRPFELGALLSAITFHGNHDKCFHSLGFGKGYGYGKIKVENPVLSILEYSDKGAEFKVKGILSYLEDFEKVMTSFKSDWKESDQLKELMAIAGGWDKNVGYMSLPEYRNAKKNKVDKSLKQFSKLNPGHFKMPDHIEIKGRPVATKKPQTATSPGNPSVKYKVGDEVTGVSYVPRLISIYGCKNMVRMLLDTKNINYNSLLRKPIKVRISRLLNGEVYEVTFISVL